MQSIWNSNAVSWSRLLLCSILPSKHDDIVCKPLTLAGKKTLISWKWSLNREVSAWPDVVQIPAPPGANPPHQPSPTSHRPHPTPACHGTWWFHTCVVQSLFLPLCDKHMVLCARSLQRDGSLFLPGIRDCVAGDGFLSQFTFWWKSCFLPPLCLCILGNFNY